MTIIRPLYTDKEVANMAADYLWRKLMQLCPKKARHKGEIANFIVQTCFTLSDDEHATCLNTAESMAMKVWKDNFHSMEENDMTTLFECAKDAFKEKAPRTIPDVLIDRYANTAANAICIEILKSS
jgi:hypothetical protein